MYSRVVVPVDASELAWTAVGPAHLLAEKWDAELELISVVHYGWEIEPTTADIERYLAAFGWQEGTIVTVLETRVRHVADVLADHVGHHEGSFVVMSSAGRGRSAALVGSVAERLLQDLPSPVLVLGPAAVGDQLAFEGRMLVCVDGTYASERALEAAAPWAQNLDMKPWVISVAEESPVAVGGETLVDTGYPHRLADQLARTVNRSVEYETLHRKDPARAIVEHAKDYGAGLIVAATHGRTGLERFSEGSVAMNIVHRAPCPVLLVCSPA